MANKSELKSQAEQVLRRAPRPGQPGFAQSVAHLRAIVDEAWQGGQGETVGDTLTMLAGGESGEPRKHPRHGDEDT